MMKTRVLGPIVGSILAACACSVAGAANLLTNGTFAAPAVPAGSFENFGTGSSGITGWTVVGPEASVVSGTFSQDGISFGAQGSSTQWVDLTGDGANSPSDGLSQTVATTAGTKYTLSFWVGNVVNPGGIFGTTSTVDLSINGGPIAAFENTGGAGTTSQNWQEFTTSFVAGSGATTLTFLNGDPANDNSNGLDNVVLSGAAGSAGVPEPATLALMGLGMAGLGFARRKRKS